MTDEEQQRIDAMFEAREREFTKAMHLGNFPPILAYNLLIALITRWSDQEMYLLN